MQVKFHMYNPALATRMLRNKVQRERLNLEEWAAIFDADAAFPNYVQNSMLLALVTGQRLGDIAKMQFSDIWDGHLHIQQEKTGTKLAIPLSLRCNSINMTLEDVISRCRDRILSEFVIHHHHTTSQAKRREALTISSITTVFSKARKLTNIEWESGTPPSFHNKGHLLNGFTVNKAWIQNAYLDIKIRFKWINTMMTGVKND